MLIACLLTSVLMVQDEGDLLRLLSSSRDPEVLSYLTHRLALSKRAPWFSNAVLAYVPKATTEARPHLIRLLEYLSPSPAKDLSGLLNKYEIPFRVALAEALDRLGDKLALRRVLGELKRGEINREDTLLVLSLFQTPRPGRKLALSFGPVRELLAKGLPEVVRRAAMRAIVAQKDEEGRKTLERIAGDATDSLRYTAVGALLALGEEARVPTVFLDLAAGRVRRSCLDDLCAGLAASGSEKALRRMLALLRQKVDPAVRAAILRALPVTGIPRAVSVVESLLKDAASEVRSAAEETLLELSHMASEESLKRLLKHENADRRLSAARALLLRDDVSALPILEELRRGTDLVVRLRVYHIYAEARRREAMESILEGLSDSKQDVRIWAARALVATLTTHYPYREFDLSLAGYTPLGSGSSRGERKGVRSIRRWWERFK